MKTELVRCGEYSTFFYVVYTLLTAERAAGWRTLDAVRFFNADDMLSEIRRAESAYLARMTLR